MTLYEFLQTEAHKAPTYAERTAYLAVLTFIEENYNEPIRSLLKSGRSPTPEQLEHILQDRDSLDRSGSIK